jgi:hypothetical protein
LGWNGSGGFTFTYNWVNDKNNGIPITASRMDTQFNDAVSGFDNCITRDNQGKPSATFLPDATASYDLGSTTFRWRAGYFSGNIATSAGNISTASTGTIGTASVTINPSTITLTGFGYVGTIDYNGSIYTTDGNGLQMICVSNGVVLSNGATSWAAISDETAKLFFDPIPVQGALARVANWRAGTYRYKWDTEETPRRVGLIAQDVAKDRPEAVSIDKDGLLNLRLAETIPDLVAALAEALRRIEALEAR